MNKGYEQSAAEKKVAAYTNPANEDFMAKQNRKGFMSAAFYFGISIAMFVVGIIAPDIPDTDRDQTVLAVFRLTGWAMLSAAAALCVALVFARGILNPLLFALNWIILPGVLVDAILRLMDAFTGMPKI